MSAAILQGVPAATLDTDLWIELPARQYLRVLTVCTNLGAKVLAPTVVALEDDTLVNFLYHIDGLRSFARELKDAVFVALHGSRVPVIPLERIVKSKEFVGRPKDVAHLPLLRQTLALNRRIRPARRKIQ